MPLPTPPEDSGYDRATADELARRHGALDEDFPIADAYGAELDKHHAWGLPFNGYANAAGYGYVQEPTLGIAQDGWDSHEAFTRLTPGAQTIVVYRSLERGHDIDRESARNFLKHERGIIIHGNQPY
ncbi:glycerophosphodiester phosphodiesterase [Bifidobacterium sp. 82T24]|uniref:glycerophosphodiester phosphodiesterase n=1 Tax=Bifidobacterium pluvialisilvae TaxID=2834436 RepID=UPI001C582E26|nr:glycerophosphodiester phosphodiesterase [Bifidobacterium pluvialisilvae]MBW3087186.1 glycerophosphodiester phosphodiesterase [Bifidobacterium pluvialisilvae]